MKNRLPAALLKLAEQLETEPPFAGFHDVHRYRLARVCRRIAAHHTPYEDLVRDISRQILGALHAAALTSDNPPTDDEQKIAVYNCEALADEVCS